MTGEQWDRGNHARGSRRRRLVRPRRLVLVLALVPLVLTLTRWGALEAREGSEPLRITSAADFTRLAPLAPESLATAFGTGLATQTAEAEGHPLPTTLGGTTVRVRGVPAPLTYVSPGQVNFQIPGGLPAGEATISVTAGDGTVTEGVTRLAPVSPGLFAADFLNKVPVGSARWYRKGEQIREQPLSRIVAGSDPDGQSRPSFAKIDPGEGGDEVYLTLFGTGIRGRGKAEDVSALIGGIPMPVVYADDPGGEAGVDLVIVKLPESLVDPGRVEVAIRIETDGPEGVMISNRLMVDVGTGPDLNVTAPWQSLITARRPKRESPSNALRPVRAPRITGLPLEPLTANSAMMIYGSGFIPEVQGNEVKVGNEVGVVEGATSGELRVRVPFYVETGSAVEVKTSQGKVVSSDVIKVRTSLSGFVRDNGEEKPIANMLVELLNQDITIPPVRTGSNGVFIFPDLPNQVKGLNTIRLNGDGESKLRYPEINDYYSRP